MIGWARKRSYKRYRALADALHAERCDMEDDPNCPCGLIDWSVPHHHCQAAVDAENEAARLTASKFWFSTWKFHYRYVTDKYEWEGHVSWVFFIFVSVFIGWEANYWWNQWT